MSEKPAKSPAIEPPLFADNDELHRQVAPHLGKDSFMAAIRSLEAEGFPPIIALFRGRYFPAVTAWLEQKYGVGANGTVTPPQDGKPNFDAPPRNGTRSEGREERPSVLDRKASHPRSNGLSRPVHSVAGGSRRG